MANFYWKLETKLPQKIETGACAVIPLEGYGFFLDGTTRSISFRLGEQDSQPLWIHQPRDDVFQSYAALDQKGFSQLSGFWGLLKVPADLAGQSLPLKMEAVREDGARYSTTVATLEITEKLLVAKAPDKRGGKKAPLVAICMATYNPEREPFQRQVQSIVDQTYANWICIVNDDGSSEEKWELIQEICSRDSRFILFQNEDNLGFYRNFEMTLRRVPDDADLVAMADQDDDWYPEKIELCVSRFGPDTQLVYTDMRIVTDDGQVLSDTYWVNRKNNHRDMDVILLANTVTGAASLFRRELLDKIIPFPERIGDAFHDNWIALSALMIGHIEYIDRPLYDYIQYRGHVIGHCDFDSLTVKGRFMRLRAYTSAYVRVLGQKVIRSDWDLKLFKRNLMMVKDYFLTEGRKNYRLLQAVFQYEYRRLQLFSETLKARTRPQTADQRFALSLFTGQDASTGKLLQAHFKISRNHHTTNDAEIRMLLAFIANKVKVATAKWTRKRKAARNFRQVRNRELEMSHATQFLAQKVAPLKIEVDSDAPRRVNILIPTIDLNLLFGGYIGKLNLARRFVACGYAVRIIIVDECDFVPVNLDGTLPSVSPLAKEFANIQFQYCFDREHQVVMNPADILVASTWWTAHIAHAAVKALKTDHFIYFIQEYEPFTFPMGTYAALANESYGFSHYPLFSSKLLKEYFELSGLGVYGEGKEEDAPKAAIFENAISTFKIDAEKLSTRPFKRVLFYARPEPHASRNMFETGVLALQQAIAEDVFDDTWEFWAAGTAQGEIPLAKGRRLKMLGKLSLDDYQKTLPEFDLGVSLMYTPHPSLVPIEMAAAGMVVITTSCLNKTAAKMAAVSPNILSVEAALTDIVTGMKIGVEKCTDIDGRIKGADVNWPKSWNESLPTELIHRMAGWFD